MDERTAAHAFTWAKPDTTCLQEVFNRLRGWPVARSCSSLVIRRHFISIVLCSVRRLACIDHTVHHSVLGLQLARCMLPLRQRFARHSSTANPCIRRRPPIRFRVAAFTAAETRLLDQFWQARGISEPEQRKELVALAGAKTEAEFISASKQATALGEGIFFRLRGASAAARSEVQSISARLLALRTLLGNNDNVDIVWMIDRAPRLLTADLAPMAQQLLHLRMSLVKSERDIMKIVERSPSLLLQQPASQLSEESEADREAALQFGLMSDGESEWHHRCRELEGYVAKHGDAHVGHRAEDDRHHGDLVRWAAKQRAAWKSHSLGSHRELRLRELEFEFDEEEALWLRWYAELRRLYDAQGPGFALPLGSSKGVFLSHWCSIQRIARRSGVISRHHYALLEDIAFDWSGADALS